MRLALADAGVTAPEVAHVNAHGTSTLLNDLAEASALTALFGGTVPPVTAVKGSTGHLVGGSGAVEAVVALETLRNGLVPPVAGLRVRDPAITLDVVQDAARRVPAGYALSNSFGFGGVNTCLVLGP
jgi:3-oxoacyl-[acyl-carrier-protein] synthase II